MRCAICIVAAASIFGGCTSGADDAPEHASAEAAADATDAAVGTGSSGAGGSSGHTDGSVNSGGSTSSGGMSGSNSDAAYSGGGTIAVNEDASSSGVRIVDAACENCPSLLSPPLLHGTNLSGAEFGSVPGTYDTTYTYPTHAEVDHFVGLGMNAFRLPFRWERLQKAQFSDLDAAELGHIDDFVDYATGRGAYVLLDPHNYARYYDTVVGDGVPATAFADFWGKIAAHYKTNDHVLFGLMNEPHDMSADTWLADANAAIAAIRSAGANNVITVPGNDWTGAHNWVGTSTSSNSQVMVGVDDPLDNFVFEMHQYLDADSSGVDLDNCASATVGSERLSNATSWLAQHGGRAILAEFGAGANTTCLAAVDDMLSFMDAHPDEWLGWTWWSAGPWWGNYSASIEPSNGQDKPQTLVLVQHL